MYAYQIKPGQLFSTDRAILRCISASDSQNFQGCPGTICINLRTGLEWQLGPLVEVEIITQEIATRSIESEIPPDITSGLGIGGIGSDDYNINTEPPARSNLRREVFGNHRPHGQLWEPCPTCRKEPVNLCCGYCNRHCTCEE